MKVKVNLYLSPDEFRQLLSSELQKLFDKLVQELVKNGLSEQEAKHFVAKEMLEALKAENMEVMK